MDVRAGRNPQRSSSTGERRAVASARWALETGVHQFPRAGEKPRAFTGVSSRNGLLMGCQRSPRRARVSGSRRWCRYISRRFTGRPLSVLPNLRVQRVMFLSCFYPALEADGGQASEGRWKNDSTIQRPLGQVRPPPFFPCFDKVPATEL